MSGKVSFEGIGEMLVTFYAGDGVTAGQTVKVSGDGTVASCAAGEKFCGMAVSVEDGCAAVQVEGFAQVSCADTAVTAGFVSLTADGTGGVKKAGSTDMGREYLVAEADGSTAVVKL